MTINVTMGSGGVGESVSMVSTESPVSGDEEDKDEDEELTYDDDEQDVNEITHTQMTPRTDTTSPTVVVPVIPTPTVGLMDLWRGLSRFVVLSHDRLVGRRHVQGSLGYGEE